MNHVFSHAVRARNGDAGRRHARHLVGDEAVGANGEAARAAGIRNILRVRNVYSL
jgi:hypothetical protein